MTPINTDDGGWSTKVLCRLQRVVPCARRPAYGATSSVSVTSPLVSSLPPFQLLVLLLQWVCAAVRPRHRSAS